MAQTRKYKIAGIHTVTVGGEQIKGDKNDVFLLSPEQAKHLGQVYQVIDEADGVVQGDGKANVAGATAEAKITKESLMKLTNEDLDDRLKSLGMKADKDDSKGDKAEKILQFLVNLNRLAETKGKK